VSGAQHAGAGVGVASAFRLTALTPVLFFNDTGTFSKPIPKDAVLANTPIGEGWAGHPSDATFVRVIVAGKPGSYLEQRAVHFVVQGGERDKAGDWRWRFKVLDRYGGGGPVSRTGRIVLGFWIPDTGCLPLRLTARLGSQSLTRILPFLCNE
jgi:hypothetical protein